MSVHVAAAAAAGAEERRRGDVVSEKKKRPFAALLDSTRLDSASSSQLSKDDSLASIYSPLLLSYRLVSCVSPFPVSL